MKRFKVLEVNNVIEEVIKYLQNNTNMNIEINDDDLQTIEFWWDD